MQQCSLCPTYGGGVQCFVVVFKSHELTFNFNIANLNKINIKTDIPVFRYTERGFKM